MSARLGEMLLKVGALTEEQLEQVLNAQAIYGGRLGTNLVEMGLIGEDDLAQVLNEKSGVPCIEAAALNSIPQEVVGMVPVDLIERYHVLPVSLEGKRLTLAMADPADFNAIEEIGFITGLVIVPRVCSELRLNMALEHYFGIKRAVRYIPVAGGSRSRFSGPAAEAGKILPRSYTAELQPEPICGDGPSEVERLAEKFARSMTETEVVSALLSYLGGEYERAAFLGVKRNLLVGVKAVLHGEPIEGFGGVAIPVEGANRLKRLVQERILFIGELAPEGAEGKLLESVGGGICLPVILVPISVGGRVAAVIGASDKKGKLSAGAVVLQRVAAMAELTFEMVCIRKRIKSV